MKKVLKIEEIGTDEIAKYVLSVNCDHCYPAE